MKTKRISAAETSPLLISSLPARPNQSLNAGGVTYTSTDLRHAFDRLPLLLVTRYNGLIDDMENGDILALISTELTEGAKLKDFFSDLKSGAWAGYAKLGDTPIHTVISDILSRLSAIEEVLRNEHT